MCHICFLWLQQLSLVTNEYAELLILKFSSFFPPGIHQSFDLLLFNLVGQTWWQLFRIFTWNIICDLLIGWSCLGDWQLPNFPWVGGNYTTDPYNYSWPFCLIWAKIIGRYRTTLMQSMILPCLNGLFTFHTGLFHRTVLRTGLFIFHTGLLMC